MRVALASLILYISAMAQSHAVLIRQPRVGMRLSDSLRQGLIWCHAPVSASVMTGASQDQIRTRYSTTRYPIWGAFTSGLAARNWRFSLNDTVDLDWTSGGFTMASFVYVAAPPSGGGSIYIIQGRKRYGSESDNEGYALQVYVSGTAKLTSDVFRDNGSANYHLIGTSTIGVGNYAFAMTSDGTRRRIYVNGVQENSVTNNAIPVSNTTGLGLENGQDSGASGSIYSYIDYMWNRSLSAAEIKQLSDDPFIVLGNYWHSAKYYIPVPLVFPAAILNNPVVQ